MLGIVCHDAGGAELVSSYLKKTNLDYIHALGGPAQDIFKRKLQIPPTKRMKLRRLVVQVASKR